MTAALHKVWAREAVNSLSHSWRFGRDHPTCCKYPARRRRGGGEGLSEEVGGLPSPPWLVSYQDLDCGRSEVFAVQLERVQQGQGWWWGAFGSGLAPRDHSSHLISPGILQSVTRSKIFVFGLFHSPLFEVRSWFISFVFPVIPKRCDPSDN